MYKDYKPLRFFTIIAAIIFLLGILIGMPVIIEFFKTKYITKIPSAILATGLVTLSVIIAQCGVILDTVVRINKENYQLNLVKYGQIEKLCNDKQK